MHPESSSIKRRRSNDHFASSGKYAPPDANTPTTPNTSDTGNTFHTNRRTTVWTPLDIPTEGRIKVGLRIDMPNGDIGKGGESLPNYL